MTREVFFAAKFRQDFKRVASRGWNMELLRTVMKTLENSVPLDPKYREHALTGSYSGHMECHIQPDWLLIYVLTNTSVTFSRTGSHADLFR